MRDMFKSSTPSFAPTRKSARIIKRSEVPSRKRNRTIRLRHVREISRDAPLRFVLDADTWLGTGKQRPVGEVPTKWRHAEVAVPHLAALMPSAGTILI